MNSRFVNGIGPYRRAISLVLLVMGVIAFGCSGDNESKRGVEGAAKLLKPEDLYRYEGEGKAKRKVHITRKEKVKLLRDAADKAASQ